MVNENINNFIKIKINENDLTMYNIRPDDYTNYYNISDINNISDLNSVITLLAKIIKNPYNIQDFLAKYNNNLYQCDIRLFRQIS